MSHGVLVGTKSLHNFLHSIVENTSEFHMDEVTVLYNTKMDSRIKDGTFYTYLNCSNTPKSVDINCDDKFSYEVSISKIRRLYSLLKLIPEQPIFLIIGENQLSIKTINL